MIGNAGSGKSSIINVLYGSLYEKKWDGICQTLSHFQDSTPEKLKMDHVNDSKNLYPAIINESPSKNASYCLLDCLSLQAGQGKEMDIMASFALKMLQDKFDVSALLVIIDYRDVRDGFVGPVQTLFDTIASAVHGHDEKSTIDMFSKIRFIINRCDQEGLEKKHYHTS